MVKKNGKPAATSPSTRSSTLPMSDQPWWVKTIVWVGVPTAVAGYLLWFIIGQLTTRIDALGVSMSQHQNEMHVLVSHLQQETEQSWVQLGVIQRICLNTAKNDTDKVACVSTPRRPSQ